MNRQGAIRNQEPLHPGLAVDVAIGLSNPMPIRSRPLLPRTTHAELVHGASNMAELMDAPISRSEQEES